ncbi:aldehyde decarbonylase protein [Dioscorea alata]|uniref:Aldehyde decarbonylase protein n=1 Tax=Dioscorea alata TaxID=55571 RepID=A0ACB7V8I9_DIOAL|nr:aldehyde decarbonylase protein [Dioscorea alata]
MASNPGPLTQWPWQRLGNFKYALLVPFVGQSVYKFFRMRNNGEEIDMFNLAIFPIFLLRLLHSQLWISLSRFKTVQSKHLIVDKSLDFSQVDRESNWDDQILLTAFILYTANMVLPGVTFAPWWNTKGFLIIILLHMGPVEFLYYWFHRALHHHFLYSRYHSHHHSSIVTQPITSVIHPFGEEMVYFMLFAIPLLTTAFTGTVNIIGVTLYLLYIDFMNYMGHCNFEVVPQHLFLLFPPLKYLMYTPSFHSLHHTQFRTNYSLFMPFYDYIYGTMDKSSDDLYERCLRGKEGVVPDVIHLSHLTSYQSIYHLSFGFASFASTPFVPFSKLCSWLLWPFTYVLAIIITNFCGSTLTLERNKLEELHMETWLIPRYNFQYMSSVEKDKINDMIDGAITKAESMGVKVISLGLLNQVRIVDGTSLAVAVVLNTVLLNTVPKGTKRVIFRGKFTQMAHQLIFALCQRDFKVLIADENEHEKLMEKIPQEMRNNLTMSYSYSTEVWLVGDGVKDEEQVKAQKGTHFIPFSQFPLKKKRKDCIYHTTPAMLIPKTFENVHTCENWLPRRVMSAWRVAGIVHALEGWDDAHECGNNTTEVDKVWCAALAHGFLPFQNQII